MQLQVERETMDADVLIVGAGAAGLSAAYHLKSLVDRHNEEVNRTGRGQSVSDLNIMVLEKGIEVGAHSFSGAVMDPSSLKEMIPNCRELEVPIESEVKADAVYYLTSDLAIKFPIVPPPFKNKGKWIVSLSKVNRWLGKQCEDKGISILPGFTAVEPLIENGRLVGVRTGDKGLDKEGRPKDNFEPGYLIRAKITIIAEGTRGSLFKQVEKALDLREGKAPDVYEEGVKEIIQMPKGTVTAGQVIHTMGFPLKETMGGTFIYTTEDDRIFLGLVGFLDTRDPLFDPHRELQRLKTHPFVAKMIKGGKVVSYGGKTIPAGGWFSMPRLYDHGLMVCGDTASMVDVQKLKGIHLAMKSGMLAAETCLDAFLSDDFSKDKLSQYETKVRESFIGKQLKRVRNFHQAISHGLLASLPTVALQEATGGRGLVDNLPLEKDYLTTAPVLDVWGGHADERQELRLPKPDGVLFFDKLSSVYLTGTQHDENSPNHLLVANTDTCRTTCHPKYKSPCNHFCPANVYEMVPVSSEPNAEMRLQVNYTNCIHCKTCDLKCPFDNISWTAPEGAGGPRYTDS